MNSSSAYSNVLNTSPVVPTVNSVPRRDLSDDSSSNEFHQALQNVREEQDRNTQAETVKAARNTPQKKAQSDNQQPVENDQAQSTKTSDTKTSDNKKSGASKKVAGDDVDEKNATDNQSVTNQVLTNKPVDDKTACGNSLLNADVGQLTADGSTANPNADEAEKLAADGKTISVDPSALATKSTDNTAAGDVSADKVATSLLVSGKNIIAGAATQDGDSKVSDKDASNAEKSQSVADDTDALSINPLALDAASAALTASTSGAAANANPTADAAALVAVAAESVKSTSGTKQVASDASTSLTAADPQSSVLASDPKSGFEKMLQAMVAANAGQQSQDSGSQSSSTESSSSQSSTATTPASVIESLARTIDSQTPAARSFVVQTSVPVTVGQPQWSQAVGEKVLWLAAQNVSSAEIRLDPPDLGPMQVKVSVNQDQTNISFTSHHPVVREVLDQNLHRLRDMFSEQGLNLGSVDVSDKSFSRQQGEGKGQQGSGGAAEGVNEEETPIAVSTIMQQRLVDHYA